MNRIVIAGTCKNVGEFLPRVIQNIYKITVHFSEYKIVIVENDSNDKTKQLLDNWAWEDENVILKTLDNIHQYVPNKKYRTEYIAFCRNVYIQEIAKLNYEYSVIIDMDDVMASDGFCPQGIINSLQTMEKDLTIGALSCISKPKYYDIWALRNRECYYDCWKRVFWSMCKESLTYTQAVNKYVNVHTKDYSQNTELIEVDSAFNGLSVYRNVALTKCKYVGLIDGLSVKPTELEPLDSEVCEHVPLNYMMKSLGYKLYINPRMIIHI